MDNKTKQQTDSNPLEHVVMWLTPHLNEYGIIYLIASYLLFVVCDIYIFNIGTEHDIYGLAMVALGFLWLTVIKVLNITKRSLTS